MNFIMCPWCMKQMEEKERKGFFFVECKCGARTPRHINKETARHIALRICKMGNPPASDFTGEEQFFCIKYGTNESIFKMGFSVRLENILQRAGIFNLAQIGMTKLDDFFKMRGMGNVAIDELYDKTRVHIKKMIAEIEAMEEYEKQFGDFDEGLFDEDDLLLDDDF